MIQVLGGIQLPCTLSLLCYTGNAFRKPFTAGTWQDPSLFGIESKTLLVTAQVLGYTLEIPGHQKKFVGAELDAHRRVSGSSGWRDRLRPEQFSLFCSA